MSKVQQLLEEAIELNKQDTRERFIFYHEGVWHGSLRIPSLIDYPTFYIVNNGAATAVTF